MKKLFCLILPFVVLLGSCSRVDAPEPDPEPWTPSTDSVDNVLIMYLMGSNSLSGYLNSNITQAMRAVSASVPGRSGRILVFHDSYSGTTLTELAFGQDGVLRYLWEDYGDYDCSSAEAVETVINDIKRLAPARHYAITIGSHGWGWLPGSLGTNRVNRSSSAAGPEAEIIGELRQKADMPCSPTSTRNMGPDGSAWIDVADLARGLSGIHFDFMMLDACFMASAEALYDLRNSADFIMASPCEVMAAGFPYERIVTDMFGAWGAWKVIADDFVDFYAGSYINSAYATIVSTAALEPLAESLGGLVAAAGDATASTSDVLYYEQMNLHIFHDLAQYAERLAARGKQRPDALIESLNRCIVYCRHTERIWSCVYAYGEWIDMTGSCGISSYIPQPEYPLFGQAHKESAWGRVIYGMQE